MSGADLEYRAMLARAGVNPGKSAGYDGARLEQMADARKTKAINDVTHPLWGAVGDGVTDDTIAIQKCVDYFGNQELAFSYVYFPAGIYLTKGIKYVANLYLKGSHRNTTKLLLDSKSNGGLVSGTMGIIGSTGESINGLILEDLTLDGNNANNSVGPAAGGLLHAYSLDSLFCLRVDFINGVGYGVGFQGSLANVSPEKRGPSFNVLMVQCNFINNGYYQGASNSADGIDIKDCNYLTLIHCKSIGNSDKGFNIRGRNVLLISPYSAFNVTGYDFNSNNDPDALGNQDTTVVVVNGIAEENIQSGLAASSTENSITTVTVYGFRSCKNGGAGANVPSPPSTGKVNFYVHSSLFWKNNRGLDINNAQTLVLDKVTSIDNVLDGVRLQNQIGGLIDYLKAKNNGGQGLAVIGALGTTSDVELRGGDYRDNVGANIGGFGLKIFNNPLGMFDTIPSAANININIRSRPLVSVGGSTAITSITASYKGDEVTLLFTDVATLTDGGNLRLAGNFTGGANRTIRLICDGTNWYEVSRSVN